MILENEVKELELEELQEEAVIAPKKTKKKTTSKKEVKVMDEAENLDLLIEQWKVTHKRLFKNEIDGEVIIWRRLKRGEYKDILKADTEEEDKILTKQELMVKAAVLYPFDVEALIDENAGLATVLSEEILAKSGFAISYTEEI